MSPVFSLGIQSLSQAYEQTPDFIDEKGAQDVTRQLAEADAMLNMLKANHFKMLQARSEVASAPIPNSPYSEYVQQRRDKHVRKETGKQKEREGERDTDRQTETERQRETETEREGERQRKTERERELQEERTETVRKSQAEELDFWTDFYKGMV